MKTSHHLLAAAICLALTGCATPFRAPADVAHVTLVRTGSPLVEIEKIWLERKQGPLVVTGYVRKQHASVDTTRTHLDIILYDASGNVLRRTVEHFEPRQIPSHVRPNQNFSTYRISLDPLPAGTAKIEVRADEETH